MAGSIWTEVKGTRRIETSNPTVVDWMVTFQGAHGAEAPVLGATYTATSKNVVDDITAGGSTAYPVTCAAAPEAVQVSDTFRGPSMNLDRVIVRFRGFVSEA